MLRRLTSRVEVFDGGPVDDEALFAQHVKFVEWGIVVDERLSHAWGRDVRKPALVED